MVFKQKEKETRERVYDLTESTQEVLKKNPLTLLDWLTHIIKYRK